MQEQKNWAEGNFEQSLSTAPRPKQTIPKLSCKESNQILYGNTMASNDALSFVT